MSLPSDIVATASVLVTECDGVINDLKQVIAEAILRELPEEYIRRLRDVSVGLASTRGKAWKLKGECGAAAMTGQVQQAHVPLISDAAQRVPTSHAPRHEVGISGKDRAAGERENEE